MLKNDGRPNMTFVINDAGRMEDAAIYNRYPGLYIMKSHDMTPSDSER